MNLESEKRLNIQLRLDFSSAPRGEARQAGGEDIESLSVTNEPERPADTRQSCQRNFSNRRVRTRTHGGVGGAEPRGSPYPDHWHFSDVGGRADDVHSGVKRTCDYESRG